MEGMREIKVTIHTFGCKSNQYDSAIIREEAIKAGFEVVPPSPETEIFVVNTCTVTGKTDYQARQMIRRFRRMNPSALVVATGCYAQVYPQEVKAIGVDCVIGNREKEDLWKRLRDFREGRGPAVMVSDMRRISDFGAPKGTGIFGRTRAFFKIQDGCDAFCSYCIIPYARGRGRSLPMDEVFRGIDGLIEKGFKEIVLTGIHIGSYGIDLGYQRGLFSLLKEVERRYRNRGVRFRISSLEPMELDRGIIEIIAGSEIFCHHLHIPLQSGSDRILEAMKRPYTSRDFAGLIEFVHRKIPHGSLGVDIIAGFPGEGEEDHLATYRLVRDLPITYFHVFPFSRRKGTPAYHMAHQIHGKVVRERCEALRRLGREKKEEFYRRNIGREEEVLIEERVDKDTGMLRGYTKNYILTLIRGERELMGKMVKVRLLKPEGDRMVGTLL